VVAIETKFPKIKSSVTEVLETCNENTKCLQSFNSTIFEFMKHMQVVQVATGSPNGKVISIANGTNPLDMLENTNVHANKGKNLALEFDISSA
jgi:hypothetical protein